MLQWRVMTLSLAFVMTAFSAHASVKDPSPPMKTQLSASLSKELNEFMAVNADLFARVGRQAAHSGRTFAAVIRCSDPQETGHADDRAYCESEVIGNSSLTEDVKNEKLTGELLALVKQTKGFYGGTAQGWMGYDAQVTCTTPNAEKPAICIAEPASKDASNDGFEDIDSGMED